MAGQRLSKRMFNICMILVIILVIVFIALMFILDYDVNGEKNMPFLLSKISIVSSVDGMDIGNTENRWNINVIQNNDMYLYFEKNEDYKKKEIISEIKIDNFCINKKPQIGEIKIYSPVNDDKILFKNLDENVADSIVYKGAKESNARNLEISNQGGTAIFRCANNNIGQFTSNDEQEINYKELLNKLNINENDIMFEISFDVTISLNSGKVFKAEKITRDIPSQGLVSKGIVGFEDENLNDIVFKRN